ncbi:MAG: diguanylate cyclase [Thermodesulfobacteriota bacterium]
MGFPRDLPLKVRFVAGVALMLLPMLGFAGAVEYLLHDHQQVIAQMVEETLHEKDPVVELDLAGRRLLGLVHRAVMQRQAGDRAQVQAAQNALDEAFRKVAGGPFAQNEEKESLRTAKAEWQVLKAASNDLLDRVEVLADSEILSGYDAIFQSYDRLEEHLHFVLTIANEEIGEHLGELNRIHRRIYLLTGVIFLASIAIVLAIGILLARSIILPVRMLQGGARELAAGNLDHRLPAPAGPRDELGELIGGFNRMADALQTSQLALRELAVRDSLTGLLNHRHFFRVLHEEFGRSSRYHRPLSMLMIDMDRFKEINDTRGHLAGDKVLREVGKSIADQIRQSDYACRYGGDEFAILLPETGKKTAFDFAARLQQLIGSRPTVLANDEEIRAGISIGVASFPEDADSANRLVAAADTALYRAKHEGRGRVCCPSS